MFLILPEPPPPQKKLNKKLNKMQIYSEKITNKNIWAPEVALEQGFSKKKTLEKYAYAKNQRCELPLYCFTKAQLYVHNTHTILYTYNTYNIQH